jgi:hypothetical protein
MMRVTGNVLTNTEDTGRILDEVLDFILWRNIGRYSLRWIKHYCYMY